MSLWDREQERRRAAERLAAAAAAEGISVAEYKARQYRQQDEYDRKMLAAQLAARAAVVDVAPGAAIPDLPRDRANFRFLTDEEALDRATDRLAKGLYGAFYGPTEAYKIMQFVFRRPDGQIDGRNAVVRI
jgi:hypothetical protein